MSDYINSDFIDDIKETCPGLEIKIDEPLKKYTSFRIGGPADYFFEPNNPDELRAILLGCKKYRIPVFIMGNGSNLLVTDKGYRGAVIQVYKKFSEINVDDAEIRAGAGILLSSLSKKVADLQLTGFEFASGIPGTLGGAVYMNAGAYGGEMKGIVSEVTACDMNGNIHVLKPKDLDFGYRHSALQTKHFIVLEALLELNHGRQEEIRAMIKDLDQRRKDKQPLEFPSAGSTFKRPKGYFAGKLIMDAGLKGYRIGDAMVSEKHCGFVINVGEATFADVKALIEHIQSTVFEQFEVKLEREVKIIGEV